MSPPLIITAMSPSTSSCLTHATPSPPKFHPLFHPSLSPILDSVPSKRISLVLTSPGLHSVSPNSSFHMGVLLLDQMWLELIEARSLFPQTTHPSELAPGCLLYRLIHQSGLWLWHSPISSPCLFQQSPSDIYVSYSFFFFFLINPPFDPARILSTSKSRLSPWWSPNRCPDFNLHPNINTS